MKTKVKFLVHEEETAEDDVFAYFPEEDFNFKKAYSKTVYSHVGQHSSCSPEYAAKSRNATPEEYADLRAELESIGYELETLN